MADIRWEVKIWQTDGTVFSGANEAGAEVRLRESDTAGADGGEYTGNVAGTGVFTDRLQGLWSIEIDSGDSGWYLVQSKTTATGVWADVKGFAPIYITRDEFLPLSGGTMSGNIVMGDNDITGISDISFTNGAVGTINSIVADNLVDKSAGADISGNWNHTGFVDITANKLKIGGTAMTMTAAQLNLLADFDTGESDKPAVLQRGLSTNTHASVIANYSVLRADLGGVIPVTTGAVDDVRITLPNLSPSANCGAMILFRFVTDGGKDMVIQSADTGFVEPNGTPSTGTTLTFADAGDWCLLVSSGIAGGKWGILINNGGTLS